MNRSLRLALTFGVAFVVALPLGFIFAPDPTGAVPLFLTVGLAAVLGLPAYLGLSRAIAS
ncbi:chitin synthase [Haloferax prahovense]|uniref:chitin synthase n=1 Tax=Haloferax TaxID=2251 RepID=UPI000A57EAA6|nr:chitin synthase [Haloferax sp. Q22]MCO8267809.1 chitin synthase [Haloferax sp. AB510]